MAIVEARHAGGHITVTIEDLNISRMVGFRAPTSEFPLSPDEARALAVRLIEAAAASERAPVDDWPNDDPDE